MEFEWDENKNETNIAKHGIDFEDARQIFEGPIVEAIDGRHEYREIRLTALGEFEEDIVFVVYTMRDNSRRIISARRANRNERRTYRETFG